jgi:hypothetical protein
MTMTRAAGQYGPAQFSGAVTHHAANTQPSRNPTAPASAIPAYLGGAPNGAMAAGTGSMPMMNGGAGMPALGNAATNVGPLPANMLGARSPNPTLLAALLSQYRAGVR